MLDVVTEALCWSKCVFKLNYPYSILLSIQIVPVCDHHTQQSFYFIVFVLIYPCRHLKLCVRQVPFIVNTLWDALLDLDDLTASTNSIMTLLSSLLTYPQVRQCRSVSEINMKYTFDSQITIVVLMFS